MQEGLLRRDHLIEELRNFKRDLDMGGYIVSSATVKRTMESLESDLAQILRLKEQVSSLRVSYDPEKLVELYKLIDEL